MSTALPSQPVRTRDEAEARMALIKGLYIRLQQETAAQNAAKAAVETRDKTITNLTARINVHTAQLAAWAKDGRRQWPGKSLQLRQGTIGFAMGNRRTAFLRGWNEQKSVLAIRRAGDRFTNCLRITYELARQRMLDMTKPEAGTMEASALKQFGIAIKQSEYFYARPKLDHVPK